jgi:hypothetical protein
MDSNQDPRVGELAETIINIIDNFRIESVISERVLFDRGLVQFKMPSEFSLRSIRESLTNYPLAAYSYEDLITVADFLRQVVPMDDSPEVENFKNSLAHFAQNIDSIGRNYQRNAGSDLQREVDYLSRRVQEIKDQLVPLSQLGVQGQTIVRDMEVLSESAGTIRSSLEKELNKASASQKQFEKSRAEIEAFAEELKLREKRLNEYEESLSTASKAFLSYETEIRSAISGTNEVVAKTDQINKLLKDAEDIVGLQATASISRAFSKQHTDSKENIQYWLIGAGVFVGAAALVTYLLLTGEVKGNEWVHIVSRVIVVTILLGAATFCSKQYIRQKAIVEDYAYKVVLSQSIIAFIDEIKTRSEGHVVEYLNKVLAEIHKDPQRPRKLEADGAFKSEVVEAFGKIIDKVSSLK